MENPGLRSPTIRLAFSLAGQAVALKVMGSSTNTYYLYSDHLGSTATMSTTGGGTVTGSTARYTPFGNWRTEPTANLTDRGFTGHLHNNLGNAPEDIGLVYMAARWYSPTLGRFISADTLVPDPANPQGWNRYTYTINNPLSLVDPSGHCWGPLSFARNTFYATTCNNLDMALTIVTSPDASVLEKVGAGGYMFVEGTAHAAVAMGTAVATRVSGDPVHMNNGIFYFFNDHLGSTASIGTSNSTLVAGSRAYYLPFGGYRGPAPTQAITDRDFTGQPENMDLGLYYYQARFYVPGIGRFASADTIVPDPANPQQYNRYTYTLNNPLRYSDPTGHRSCSPEQTATGDETCDENIINNEWLAFQRRMQAQLTGRYGYYGNRKVVFASGPNEYTPKNVVTRPSSIPELHAMIAIGEQAVLSLGSPTTACHPLAGAMNGYSESEFRDTWNNERYRQSSINSVTDVLVFAPLYRGHSASVVLFDHDDPENSILIQTNAGAHMSGIFFTRLGETNFEGIDGGDYIGLNLPDRSPIKAVAVDLEPVLIPDNANDPTRR